MSSAIRHVHYKPDIVELSVWFGPEGGRYKYFAVPPFVAEALQAAESRGRFFNQFIRGRYACSLVDPSERKSRRWEAIRSAS